MILKNKFYFNRMFYLFIIYLFFVNFSLTTSHEENTERLILDNADRANGDMIRDRSVLILTGNVKFHQGDAILLCHKAFQYLDDDHTILTGNVQIYDQSKQLFGDQIDYYEKTKFANAEGNVKLIDSSKTLTADYIKYFQEQEKAIADSNVTIQYNDEHIFLVGKHAEYFRNDGYARVTGEPVFTRIDTTNNTELVITGELMEMFDEGDSVIVTEKVHITRGEIVADCEKLLFIKKEEKIILGSSPIAYEKDDHLTGKQIILFLKENKVNQIHITGDAIVTTKVDSALQTNIPYNLLTGEQIQVILMDEKIDTVIVLGRATSYYHILEDNEEKGINKILCDELVMVFDEGKIKYVTGKSNPGMSNGIFFPPASQNKIEGELTELLKKLKINRDIQQPLLMPFQ